VEHQVVDDQGRVLAEELAEGRRADRFRQTEIGGSFGGMRRRAAATSSIWSRSARSAFARSTRAPTYSSLAPSGHIGSILVASAPRMGLLPSFGQLLLK
jgi:hypothetical protein